MPTFSVQCTLKHGDWWPMKSKKGRQQNRKPLMYSPWWQDGGRSWRKYKVLEERLMPFFLKGSLQLEWTPSRRTRKINSQKIVRATTNSRLPMKSFWQGESKSAVCLFLLDSLLTYFFQDTFPNTYCETTSSQRVVKNLQARAKFTLIICV